MHPSNPTLGRHPPTSCMMHRPSQRSLELPVSSTTRRRKPRDLPGPSPGHRPHSGRKPLNWQSRVVPPPRAPWSLSPHTAFRHDLSSQARCTNSRRGVTTPPFKSPRSFVVDPPSKDVCHAQRYSSFLLVFPDHGLAFCSSINFIPARLVLLLSL